MMRIYVESEAIFLAQADVGRRFHTTVRGACAFVSAMSLAGNIKEEKVVVGKASA